MAAEPFATATDLAARWRPLTTTETAVADTLLAAASRRLRATAAAQGRNLDTEIAAETLDPDLVVDVVCAMVKRAMIGGGEMDGVTQASQTAGPFSQSRTYANPLGNVYVGKDDLLLLGLSMPSRGGRAFSVDLSQAGGPAPARDC